MINTIKLEMESDSFVILNHDVFAPSSKGLFQAPFYTLGARGSYSCYLNPTKKDLLFGRYFPNITATRRAVRGGFQVTLKVEFSAPKLIYRNNFDELTEDDLPKIVLLIKQRLSEKGILVRDTKLLNAKLSKIDYGKNIILDKFISTRTILTELNKVDMPLFLDLEEVKFRNAGYGIKFRNNGFELACYDKVKDLQKGKKSDKKSEEKDNAIQLNLLEPLLQTPSIEVLRVEMRLNSRQKIKHVLKLLGYEIEPTLNNCFKKEIAQKVVSYYWSSLETSYNNLNYHESDIDKEFTQLLKGNPSKRTTGIIQQIGLRVLINKMGARGLRTVIRNRSPSTWRTLINNAADLNTPKMYWSPLQQVTDTIERFETVKLAEHYDKIYSK